MAHAQRLMDLIKQHFDSIVILIDYPSLHCKFEPHHVKYDWRDVRLQRDSVFERAFGP